MGIPGMYGINAWAHASSTAKAAISGTASANDPSNYFGANPQIAINKVTVDGATSGDGLTILTGEPISWKYTVTDPGNVPLSIGTANDNNPGTTPACQRSATCNNGKLELGAT